MQTVRGRVLELTADSGSFSASEQIDRFDDPERAKLEADAYLAIAMDGIVDTLVSSDLHKLRFRAYISREVTDSTHAFTNKGIDRGSAFTSFKDGFSIIYGDYDVFNNVLAKKPLGGKVRKACDQYIGTAQKYAAGATAESLVAPTHLSPGTRQVFSDQALAAIYEPYRHPAQLVNTGIKTFAGVLPSVLSGLYIPGSDVEKRLKYLGKSDRSLRRLASLSLHQAGEYKPAPATFDENGVDITPDIRAARELPLHQTRDHAALRGHHKCLALPVLPENETLHGGSGIVKLWELASDLIVTTNFHALDSDDIKHDALGYDAYDEYRALGHTDI